MRVAARLGWLFVVLAAAGCGSGQGKVTGQVLLDGKPVTGGIVTFQPADSRARAVTTTMDADGNFDVSLPAGEVKVSVDNRELQPAPKSTGQIPANLPPEIKKKLMEGAKGATGAAGGESAEADKPPGKYVPIPAKYYTIESSGLKFTVERGDQKHNIELTSK